MTAFFMILLVQGTTHKSAMCSPKSSWNN